MDVICSSVMKRLIGIFCAAAIGLVAQDTRYPADGSQIPGPGRRATPDWVSELSEWQIAGSGEHEAWLNDLRQWRRERLIRMGYDDAEYRRPELLWTQRNFIQPQMMAEERYFYDPAAGKYTVDRYLDDVDKRYGGIDSVLIWPVYPNIGIDDLGAELGESGSAATAVAPTPDGAGAHADHEPTASGGSERRAALEEEVVAGSGTGTTGGDPVSPMGEPAAARPAGVAGPTEPDDRQTDAGD